MSRGSGNQPDGTARLDDRGRLVLPAAMRRRLGLEPGDLLLVSESDGVLRLASRRAAARGLIGLAGSADHSTVEELRSQRRRDASGEDLAARRSSR
ncbi:MAG: AbrB/MazE/SpoVT family DNA-binding domain-containing protein [Actinomycetota bacterium]|nr:AbrB/MazE/SpoVT family DNA-binding domain-containing protein [Actinomycetota bacterium]